MKTVARFMLLLAAFLGAAPGHTQQKKCLTFESIQDYRANTPGAATDADFENWLKPHLQAAAKNRTTLSTYTIPIVFHVIHNGEAIGTGTNISAAQIQQQLAQLNADFANASGSPYAVAANANIQFTLAVIDPQGRRLAEPGIERVNLQTKGWQAPPYDISTYNSYPDVNIVPQTIWSPYRYFNVWVMPIAGTILGRSTFPSFSGLTDIDGSMGETDTNAGVMLDYRTVGSKNMPGPNTYWGGMGRTLTHEAGHFLGLHHIWGNSECGTDYCDDTPRQKDNTDGCPGAVTASGCEVGINRMYQNYMDYTWDNCVNTFTANQVARMQAVMLNSPRRKELVMAGTDVAPAANLVRFENVSFSFSESGTVATACPAYREVQVNLNLFDAADDQTTLQLIAGGTAQQGLDYELLTPTLTFEPGEATKTMVLRIWDDAIEEVDESIELQYSIVNGNVQPADENQVLTIQINDNDGVKAISSNGVVTLMREDFDGNGGAYTNSWSNLFFGPQEGRNQWVVGTDNSAGFTNQFAFITNNKTTKANAYTITSAASVGYLTGPINAKGFSDVLLRFKYKCAGEVFMGTPYDYGTLFYSLDGKTFHILPNHLNDNYSFLFVNTTSVTQFEQSLGAMFDNQTFYLGFLWENDDLDGSGSGFMIDDIVITGKALAVAQTTGETGKQTALAGQSILLKNTAGTALIAKIENAAADLGCVTAIITQVGTTLQPITTDAGSFQRSQKVVQITPQNSTSATITLYFTDAELAQWESLKAQLKVLKVADGVSLNGILTAKNAEIITPVVAVFAAEGYTAYTFSVQSFSQFMLVSPTFTLPVQLVQFTAKAAGKQIALSWQTAHERENRGFWLERSTDGLQFDKLTWVPASTTNQYSFTDGLVQMGQVYYYRLQQVDFDGATTYSAIRQAQVTGAGISLQVAPNPASSQVQVLLSGQQQPYAIKLLNASGAVVGLWKEVDPLAGPFRLPMAHLPRGIYTILAFTADGIRSQKIIKQ